MAKVFHQTKIKPGYDFEEIISGECSNCGYKVHKTVKKTDNTCPNCGLWLDWEWDYGYAEDKRR